MGDFVGIGDAAKRVFGNGMGHRDRALDKLVERLWRAVARRHHRLLAADKHPQPEIVTLGALELFGLAEATAMRQRDALKEDRIGGIGAGAARAADQILQQVDRVICFDLSHQCSKSHLPEGQHGTPVFCVDRPDGK